MTRRFLIAGNWKMNCGPADTADLLEGLKTHKPQVSGEIDVLVCPPFVSLSMAAQHLYETDIQVGAQNIHFEDNGAYTGEISAEMVTQSGCNYVILGHSERRQYFGETNETVNKRVHKALEYQLAPVICVGESLEQRKENEHYDLIEQQITEALEGVSENDAFNVVIAYEPVWAIGTGETASPEQAQEIHFFIRKVLSEIFDEKIADSIRILYGGSMKPQNAEELLSQDDVDGGLIGGASLQAESFAEIITIAEKLG